MSYKNLKYNQLSEYDAQEEVVVSLNVNVQENLIIFTSLKKAHVLEYSNDYKITLKKSIDLVSIGGKRDIKNSLSVDKVAICDDAPQVLICNLKDLAIQKSIPFKNQIVDLNINGDKLAVVEADKLYVYSGDKLLFEKELPNKIEGHSFRTVRISKDEQIYCLHRGKVGASYISKFNMKGELQFSKNVYSKPCNSFEISNSEDPFFCISIGDGILVLNSNFKQLFINPRLHGFATSCSDILIEQDHLKVLTGGFDKTFTITKVKFGEGSFFFYSFLIFLLSLLIHQYKSFFNQ